MSELTTALGGKRPNDRTAQAAQAREADETSDKIRISLDISPALNEKLRAMARDMNGTKSDVLRRSLALMEVALQAAKDGKKVGIADRSEQLNTEIIGLRY